MLIKLELHNLKMMQATRVFFYFCFFYVFVMLENVHLAS